MKPISKLLKNLKHVIAWNSDTPDTDDVDFSKPYIISAAELHSVFKENAKNNFVPMQQNQAENVEKKGQRLLGLGVGVRNEQRLS